MGEATTISWATHTYNPWVGCTPVSPGCQHCYARAFGKRLGVRWGAGAVRRRAAESTRREPLEWDRRAARTGVRPRVFCGSLMDWLDPEVPAEWLGELLAMVWSTPNLTWLLLTKRPELYVERLRATTWIGLDALALGSHVWLGASVEDQERADKRIPALMEIPARIRFLSCEPLLGPLDLGEWLLGGPDWLILGGESGAGARPCDQAWIRSLIAQGREYGQAVWVKQLGSVEARARGLRDRKGADPAEWPADLRIQELPEPGEAGQKEEATWRSV